MCKVAVGTGYIIQMGYDFLNSEFGFGYIATDFFCKNSRRKKPKIFRRER